VELDDILEYEVRPAYGTVPSRSNGARAKDQGFDDEEELVMEAGDQRRPVRRAVGRRDDEEDEIDLEEGATI
jgi:hypothetical protein